jgi:two-component system, chemotaxis family, chemotaxis protein CheY
MTRARRHRPAPAAARPHQNGRPPALAHGRILVVDDHADTRDLLLTILKTEGYDVALADDGDVAVQRYRERPADVVLMDLYMPRKDGVATIRQLCAEFPGVVIVAMSGDAGSVWRDALAEAHAAGAQLTLRKPLEPWLLLRALEGLVAARRTLDARLHRSA